MDNKDLLKEIAKHASIVDMHIKRLKKKPDKIHEIDIDMLAEKLKDLYSLVFELETGKAIEEIHDERPVAEPERKAEPEPESEPEPTPEPVIEQELQTETEVKKEPQAEPEVKQTPQAEPVMEKEPEVLSEPETHDEPAPESVPEPKTTADLFTGATTIADTFQNEEDKSIAARVVPAAVKDLKMAIGINDKFLFINELFKGNPGEYNDALEQLNTAGAMTEAEASINTFRTKYDWSDQSEAYNRLKKIVQAKFNGS
ncbi:MAG: hypothetical protein ABFS05_04915 [Bacteroidota bacterium]